MKAQCYNWMFNVQYWYQFNHLSDVSAPLSPRRSFARGPTRDSKAGPWPSPDKEFAPRHLFICIHGQSFMSPLFNWDWQHPCVVTMWHVYSHENSFFSWSLCDQFFSNTLLVNCKYYRSHWVVSCVYGQTLRGGIFNYVKAGEIPGFWPFFLFERRIVGLLHMVCFAYDSRPVLYASCLVDIYTNLRALFAAVFFWQTT